MCEPEGRRSASLMRRKLILWVLTLANCTNFWQRNLLYALASAFPRQCLEACDDAVFVPLCDACDVESCVTCQQCRANNDAAFYSLRDASCMSDRQYGLLASVSFTVMFAASGIVAGTIADRFSEERWLHAGAVLVWSLASFAKVVSPNFTVLFVTRLVLGVAQGFNAPCAYPVLAYHFSPAERATANGVYSTGTYLGSALSSLSLLAAVYLGWRAATTAAVVVGIFASALVYLIVERPPKPLRHFYDEDETVLCGGSNEPRLIAVNGSLKPQSSENEEVSITAAWIRVRDNRRLLLLYVATSLRMTTTVALWTYLPTYYGRAFPRDVSAFSAIYAVGTLVCGSTSSAFGGALADAFVRRGYSGAHGFVPAVGTFVSVLTVAAALHVHNFFVSVSLLLLSILLSECWLGPGMGLLAKDVPPTTIGTHVSLLLVCNQLLACFGPWAISLADDGTVLGLRRPVLAVASLFSLAAAAAFAVLGAMHTHTAHAASRAGPPSPASNSSDYRREHSNNNLVAYTHEEARSLLANSSYIPS